MVHETTVSALILGLPWSGFLAVSLSEEGRNQDMQSTYHCNCSLSQEWPGPVNSGSFYKSRDCNMYIKAWLLPAGLQPELHHHQVTEPQYSSVSLSVKWGQ